MKQKDESISRNVKQVTHIVKYILSVYELQSLSSIRNGVLNTYFIVSNNEPSIMAKSLLSDAPIQESKVYQVTSPSLVFPRNDLSSSAKSSSSSESTTVGSYKSFSSSSGNSSSKSSSSSSESTTLGSYKSFISSGISSSKSFISSGTSSFKSSLGSGSLLSSSKSSTENETVIDSQVFYSCESTLDNENKDFDSNANLTDITVSS